MPAEWPLHDGVVLRTIGERDAEAFAAHVAGDGARLGEHLSWPASTADVAGAAAWLRAYERGEDGRVLVAGLWEDGALVGGALLFHHDPESATVELGCWTTAAGEGRGLAAAACRALLAHARRELGAERVVWEAATANARSRRLAERLGFVHEGTLRSAYALRGARLDIDILSLVGAELDAAVAR